jgi:AraC family transcriptional regulator
VLASDDIVAEMGGTMNPGLSAMLQIAKLLQLALNCLESHGDVARSYLRDAEVIIHRKLRSLNPSIRTESSQEVARGLAPWQIAKATEYIESRLEEKLILVRMAHEVQLSYSHFSRAFKTSLGISPRRFVTARRIDRAKARMISSLEPLSYIALECGFCDQAHFSRSFRRHVGIPPREWRRLNHKEASESLPMTALRPRLAQ